MNYRRADFVVDASSIHRQTKINPKVALVSFVAVAVSLATIAASAQDPLPSWNDGPAKQAIVDFVKATTTEGGPQFVAPEARVAAFDQDGTL